MPAAQPPILTFTIGGKIESKTNARVHWSKRHRKSRLEREHASYATMSAFRTLLREEPSIWFFDVARDVVQVRLVRCSPRPLDDDNLREAFKSIRDGIADQFGVADNHDRLSFDYGQETLRGSLGRNSHVRIEISDKGQA